MIKKVTVWNALLWPAITLMMLSNSAFAADECPSDIKAVTNEDARVPVEVLTHRVKPLTKCELEAEAQAWLLLLKAKVEEISNAEVAAIYKKEEIKKAEKVEEALDLSGHSMTPAGFFVVAQTYFSLGTADLVAALKYGYDDLRLGLERASARETATRVAVGALCRQLLGAFGIEVGDGGHGEARDRRDLGQEHGAELARTDERGANGPAPVQGFGGEACEVHGSSPFPASLGRIGGHG